MVEYALSANIRTFSQIKCGMIGWEKATGEGDRLLRLSAGDQLVAKFAHAAVYGEQDETIQRSYLTELGLALEEVITEYDGTVHGGQGSVPFVLNVTGKPVEEDGPAGLFVTVPVGVEVLPEPISTQAFLRLRALPETIAAQFKGVVSRGRHIQEVPAGLVAALRAVSESDAVDTGDLLRRYSLVKAPSVAYAKDLLTAAGRGPTQGDEAFLVTRASLPGLAVVREGDDLRLEHEPIAQSPEQTLNLLADAQHKATPSDPFSVQEALAACEEMIGFLDGSTDVLPIDDFSRFYERYKTLSVKVNQAMVLAQRPLPEEIHVPTDGPVAASPETSDETDEAAALAGLSVEAVQAALPPGFEVPRSAIAAAVTALRAGKHLLLGGPPGTGKTTFAEALCRVVVGHNYSVTTATADWTTFDTIGGYLPSDEGLAFTPGVVLRALRDGMWLLIDEVNRADIDKAFGPLFTVLSGADGESVGRRSVLPYSDGGRSVAIEWAESRRRATTAFALTPTWRMIGTLNLSDKTSLFRLSFAFLRRFAVIDIPLPDEKTYEGLLSTWLAGLKDEDRITLVTAAVQVAYGPVPIGPAITLDVCRFVVEGLVATASGLSAFPSAQSAFVAATRLFVVPQYEGAPLPDGEVLEGTIRRALPGATADELASLARAIAEVCLT